jgi:arylsulfatase A-like enzyme
MVHSVDQCVGRLVDCLKENDLLENTLIVFMSDNGPLTWTGTDGIYDPRRILNRHTANAEFLLGKEYRVLEQDFTTELDTFLVGFCMAAPVRGQEGNNPSG